MMNDNEKLAVEVAPFYNLDDGSVSAGSLGRGSVRHGVLALGH